LLRYCVISTRIEPLFFFLTDEYRLRPTHAAALALYDVFCAQTAPARLGTYELLPPRELTVSAAIARIREEWQQFHAPQVCEPPEPIDVRTPSRNLFDRIARGVRDDPAGRWARVSSDFDPRLTPQENLPGATMSAGQRHFVENVWHPVAKPRLVTAGFWQVATIG